MGTWQKKFKREFKFVHNCLNIYKCLACYCLKRGPQHQLNYFLYLRSTIQNSHFQRYDFIKFGKVNKKLDQAFIGNDAVDIELLFLAQNVLFHYRKSNKIITKTVKNAK